MAKTVELTWTLLVCSTDLDQSQASWWVNCIWSPVWNPGMALLSRIGPSLYWSQLWFWCSWNPLRCLSVYTHLSFPLSHISVFLSKVCQPPPSVLSIDKHVMSICPFSITKALYTALQILCNSDAHRNRYKHCIAAGASAWNMFHLSIIHTHKHQTHYTYAHFHSHSKIHTHTCFSEAKAPPILCRHPMTYSVTRSTVVTSRMMMS